MGATCGSWWTGEKDVYGLPSGLMQCGTPRGYFNINIKANGDYNFSFKGVGLDDNDQMSIWINRQDTLDTWIDELNDTDSYVAIANVYAGSDSTSVYYRLNGEESGIVCKRKNLEIRRCTCFFSESSKSLSN